MKANEINSAYTSSIKIGFYRGKNVVFYNPEYETRDMVIARTTMHYLEVTKWRFSTFTDDIEHELTVATIIHEVQLEIANTLFVATPDDIIPEKYSDVVPH